jgi:ubiquinone/menaquinone biosynthesis C-methylase UbiE
MISKRSIHKLEKLARIYDDEILPIWSQRFGRMMLRDLDLPERCQILDMACATGFPALDIIRRMGTGSRFIAIDGSSALLDVARRKVAELGAKGVFFRSEIAGARLPFADSVYDLVISNLGLSEVEEPAATLADYARVTVPGGEVRCTLPLEGTFEEFHDIYREVLTKHDKNETLARLEEHIARAYPSAASCEEWIAAARLSGKVEVDRFTMLFRSSREFFFAPIIEFGPLISWKEIAGTGQEMQDIFWYIKEAIDAYFEGRAFAVTVVAGCLIGRKAKAVEEARPTIFDKAVLRRRPTTGGLQPALVVPDETEPSTDHDPFDTLAGLGSAPRRPDTDEEEEIEAFADDKPPDE